MENAKISTKTNLTNELARERSPQAADRTLMAWVRTALSLIGFGFGIANFRDIISWWPAWCASRRSISTQPWCSG